MTDLERKEINDALYIVDQILPLLVEAKAHFKSARNWGFFDILGGGFITDLIKHSKLGNAANIMNRINYLLMDLPVYVLRCKLLTFKNTYMISFFF